MGLDTSHGCWHGAYGAFMVWRSKIAEVAGFPPLMWMEGFSPVEGSFSKEDMDIIDKAVGMARYSEGPVRLMCNLIFEISLSKYELPIGWEIFGNHPLVPLLSHSDCDGELAWELCGPMADALEALLPKLPIEDNRGHIGNWKDKTATFIEGLRLAFEKKENVDFH